MYSEDKRRMVALDAVIAILTVHFSAKTGKAEHEVLSELIGSKFYEDFVDLEQGWYMCDILGVADKFSAELGYPKLTSLY